MRAMYCPRQPCLGRFVGSCTLLLQTCLLFCTLRTILSIPAIWSTRAIDNSAWKGGLAASYDTSMDWNDLGVSLLNEGKQKLALQAFERAIWLDKMNDKAYDNRFALLNRMALANRSGELGREEYVTSRLGAPARAAPVPPPGIRKEKTVDGQRAFLDFLGSAEFHDDYFERWPLVLRGPRNMFDWALSMERILSDWYVVGNGGYRPPYRNVNFLKESLAKRNGEKGLPQAFALRSGLLSALEMGYSMQMLHAEHWVRSLARYSLGFMNRTDSISSVNIYISPPDQVIGTPPHVDFTGSWIIQLNGRKRWKLWKKENVWLPVVKRHILGRDEDDSVSNEKLGEPYMDIVLSPGDALWVPRGCIHSTSTKVAGNKYGSDKTLPTLIDETSVHLTTHVARLHDFGGMEQILVTGLGGNENPIFESRWGQALDQLLEGDVEFRRGLNFRNQGWKASLRDRMHTVVDKLFDETDYLNELELQCALSVDRRKRKMLEFAHVPSMNSLVLGAMPHDLLPKNMLADKVGDGLVGYGLGTYDVDPFAPQPGIWGRFAAHQTQQCKGKWAKHQIPGLKNDDYVSMDIPYIGSEVAPKLYGADAPAKLSSAQQLQFTCVYASVPGACQDVAVIEEPKSRKAVAIIVLQFKRPHHLKRLLADLSVQTHTFDLFFMNNNAAASPRCRVEYEIQSFLRKFRRKKRTASFQSIWTHHSPTNIGPMLSYVGAHALAKKFDRFIMLDDDVASPPNMVEQMLLESIDRPADVFSTWALKFLNLNNYWDRGGSEPHEVVNYCGSAQMSVPASLFRAKNFTKSFFSAFPARYRSVSDMWLNAYATESHQATLRRSKLPEHASLDAGVKAGQDVALSTRTGMRNLKTEFLQFLSTESPGVLQAHFQNLARL